MLITLVVLSSLLAMGGLAVLAVQRSSGAIAHERFRAISMSAAESGVVAGMVYLREEYSATNKWSALVTIDNQDPLAPLALPGNKSEPGQTNNPFSEGLGGWYEVSILNNPTDPGLPLGNDTDSRVILRSVGHGPNGTTSTVEVQISGAGLQAGNGRPCPGYAQRGIGEDGSGRNDCLGNIDETDVKTYAP